MAGDRQFELIASEQIRELNVRVAVLERELAELKGNFNALIHGFNNPTG